MDIDQILRRWGQWCRQDSTLGIKALSIYDSPATAEERASLLDTIRRQALQTYGMSDDEARYFDHALIGLKAWNSELFYLLKSAYVDRKSQRDIANLFGIAQPNVNRKLIVAKGFLSGVFWYHKGVKTLD